MTIFRKKIDGDGLEHQLLHLLLVLFLLFQVEHGAEDPVPDRAAYTKTFMIILVMMQVVIAPQWFHPSERRIPGMNGIVHGAIE